MFDLIEMLGAVRGAQRIERAAGALHGGGQSGRQGDDVVVGLLGQAQRELGRLTRRDARISGRVASLTQSTFSGSASDGENGTPRSSLSAKTRARASQEAM